MKAFQLPCSVICLQFSKLHKLQADVDIFSIGWCSSQGTASLMTRFQSKCPKGKHTHTHTHTHPYTDTHQTEDIWAMEGCISAPETETSGTEELNLSRITALRL